MPNSDAAIKTSNLLKDNVKTTGDMLRCNIIENKMAKQKNMRKI